MFGLFRKPKTESADIDPKPAGIFSTDLDLVIKNPKPLDVSNVIKRTFQKDITDFLPINADGTAIAMDSINSGNGLNNLKLTNSFGQGIPWAQLGWYASQGFIGYQNAAMISQQWLVDKACTMPALDAVRNGYDVTVNDGTEIEPEILDEIREKDKEYGVKDQCTDFIRKGRIFGIRIAMFLVESKDKLYYEKPFNPDGVTKGSYKGITQIDPYWITPELDFEAVIPGTKYFYEPTWWRINGKRIHRTHLVIMRNGNVPDILKPTYLYGGIPVPQKIAERVYAAERTANEAPMLAMSKRMIVLKTDMTQVAANLDTFASKLQAISQLWNNYGNRVIGGEEEINQYDTTLGDVDTTTMTQYQLVAAASEVPATKLLGTSPKGFNATGEYEAKSYRQFLESLQENFLTPLVDRHHLLLIRSEFSDLFKKTGLVVQAVWKTVDSPTAKEEAEINNLKADADNKWVQAGAIDGTDVRNRIISDPDSGYNGIPDIVPNGPGDRQAQQENEGAPLEGAVQESNKAKPVKDAADFDPVKGTLGGARIITHQRYLDEEKVAEKIRNRDFMVNVTPEFEDEGKKYRMIIDGHHSLEAAMRMSVLPDFVTSIPRTEVFNAATRQATDNRA